MEGRKVLLALAIKFGNNWDEIYKCVKEKVRVEDEFNEQAENSDANYLALVDKEYPKGLRDIYKPPFVVYYEGDLKVLDEKLTYVIGENSLGIRDTIKVENNIVKVGNRLKIWSDTNDNTSYRLAVGLCSRAVITQEIEGVKRYCCISN